MEINQVVDINSRNIEAIQSLLGQLSQTEIVFTEKDLELILTSPFNYLYFIGDKEKVMGMITLCMYACPTGIKAWIEDVVVDKNYRNKGLAKKLIQKAIEQAKLLNADMLMLTSNPTRVAANMLYRSIGFEQRETNVYRLILK